jgi:TfoX/Sxy family transcriptional regulator of competence genes
MAYDESLALRVQSLLERDAHVTEKKMFGGIAFLVQGNMAVGVHEHELIVRLPAHDTDEALEQPGTRIFDLSGGRPMKGWLLVSDSVLTDDNALASWVEVGRSYAQTLPPK